MPAGRPPKYKSAEELVKKAQAYFKVCTDDHQLPEKAGLCLSLGVSRDTYSEYRKKYPDAIKGLDLYIESNWVRRLASNAPTGAIFYLKNAFSTDYRDRTETDVTSKGEKVQGFTLTPPNAGSDQTDA